MASIAATIANDVPDAPESDISLLRLYVLRATYALLIVGLGAMIVPDISSVIG